MPSRLSDRGGATRRNPPTTETVELLAGISPAGPALDARDLSQALRNQDPTGAALAAVGFIPGAGDVLKKLGHALRRGASPQEIEGLTRLAGQTDELAFRTPEEIKELALTAELD